MALQSSGQISTSDINTELGRSGTAEYRFASAAGGTYGTINTASASKPDNIEPHYISEWYSYDHGASSYTNSHYAAFTRGNAIKVQAFAAPFQLSGSQDLSISIWVRKGATVANEVLWDISASSSGTSDRFFLQYHYSLNRFIVRHRTSSTNYDRQYALHDNNSSTGTGTNSGTKWSSSNRGNVNSDNFNMLTVTYDASQSNSLNGIKLYWNATEISSSAANASGSRTTRNPTQLTWGNNNHNPTTTAGGYSGDMDEMKIFTSVLSASDVASLYNSGTVADAANSHSTGLRTEFTIDSTLTADSNGDYATVVTNSATRTAY